MILLSPPSSLLYWSPLVGTTAWGYGSGADRRTRRLFHRQPQNSVVGDLFPSSRRRREHSLHQHSGLAYLGNRHLRWPSDISWADRDRFTLLPRYYQGES